MNENYRPIMSSPTRRHWRVASLPLLVILLATLVLLAPAGSRAEVGAPLAQSSQYLPVVFKLSRQYVLIGWNNLGMHCYDLNYADMAVLPPYNTIWAQVIQRGNPPIVLDQGVAVTYSFRDNSESASKTDFWIYAQDLFGLAAPLTPNIGLTGKGMSGEMDRSNGYFIAEGIPITEFRDSAPAVPYYYQLADLVARDSATGRVLATTTFVAPVSSEMRCYDCHNEPNANFRWNILTKHDEEEGTNLMGQRPVLCSDCHGDPALGKPTQPGIPTLSAAMHRQHAEEGVGPGDCYACHPGPQTRCLRDVMSQSASQIWCTDCHGHLSDLGNSSRVPWQDEPRCGTCHDAQFAENPGTLYRDSTGHGGLYCESCHNSTHAILPSREGNDNLQSIALQGYSGTIGTCTVCHLTRPSGPGPHQ
jgi:hypothetical protein